MDALTTLKLEDYIHPEEKPEETSEKDWDKMNRSVTSHVLFNTRYQVSSVV